MSQRQERVERGRLQRTIKRTEKEFATIQSQAFFLLVDGI